MNLDTPAPSVSLFTSLSMLFRLTLRQLSRGRRLLVLALVFSLPVALAILSRFAIVSPRPDELENVLIFGFLAVVLVPVTCLLYANGMIQDEIEEQTLTYLLIRPIPRGLIYLTRLLATYTITLSLAMLFTLITFLVVWWESDKLIELLQTRLPPLLGILAMTTFVYTSLFGCMSLYFVRLLPMGLAYIILIEGFLSTVDIVVRQFAVAFYFRLLVLRWLDIQHARSWSMADTTQFPDTGLAPSLPLASTCVLTLVLAGLVLTVVGMWVFRSTEYKVKTPGES